MEVKGYTHECGKYNPPGTKSILYLVCAADVDATLWPDFLATLGTGDSITLDGDITLLATKKFAKVDIIPNTGKVMHEAVGARTAKSYTNKFDFKLAKDIGADEWANNHINACFIGIVVEKDGTKRVFGTPDCPAFIESATGDGGAANADERSWVFQIMDDTGRVCPVYTGVIDLTA